jgi:hypothetical protein
MFSLLDRRPTLSHKGSFFRDFILNLESPSEHPVRGQFQKLKSKSIIALKLCNKKEKNSLLHAPFPRISLNQLSELRSLLLLECQVSLQSSQGRRDNSRDSRPRPLIELCFFSSSHSRRREGY